MTSMSDDGDRTCPLCAEEMDLTDQQLKPCKCGYEVCVWCWHHIMEMAEKEEIEGRCPACRTPYDKERVVRMAANCERMVAEINAEKKQKAQKAKSKSSLEAKKHLTGVRVVQRNLVYIVGLPSNLCDENILERREYFGQYGKVLKVSISRPISTAALLASTNNTFSVYITYAKEEEAIRCIQAVHNFVLEGKSIRACFGTTKYCHAWLRNMACSNPDCLYLHDVGSQEDSFTKDEIISAYTRSRVPQLVFNTSQKRSGNILPPPTDDLHNNSGTVSGKHASKNYSNNASSQTKISPNTGTMKSTLPVAASWGLRGLTSRTAATSVPCSPNVAKPKVEPQNNSVSNSSTSASAKLTSAWYDDETSTSKSSDGKLVTEIGGICRTLKSYKPGIRKDSQATTASESLPYIDISSIPSAWNDDIDVASKTGEEGHMTDATEKSVFLEPQTSVNDVVHQPLKLNMSSEDVLDGNQSTQISCLSSSLTSVSEANISNVVCSEGNTVLLNSPSPKDITKQLNNVTPEKLAKSKADHVNLPNLCIGISSVIFDGNRGAHSVEDQEQNSICITPSVEIHLSESSRLEPCNSKKVEQLPSSPVNNYYLCSNHIGLADQFDTSPGLQKQAPLPPANGMENSSVAADDQKLRLSGATDQKLSSFVIDSRTYDSTLASSWNDVGSKESSFATDPRTELTADRRLFASRANAHVLSNGHQEDLPRSICKPGKIFSHPGMCRLEGQAESVGKFDSIGNIDKAANVDREESSIISDILSLDFDPWDESSSSANNFVERLGESEKHDGAFNFSTSWNLKNSNESRFSFARQECQVDTLQPSVRGSNHEQKFSLLSQNSHGGGYQNGFLFQPSEGLNATAKTNLTYASDRPTGVARTKISAPPGFSMPSRVPPGFASQSRSNQAYDVVHPENNQLCNFSSENQYQGHLHGGSGDIEFIDPAILAVGKGRMPGINDSGFNLQALSSYPTQFNASNSDPRIHLLMQHQNLKMSDQIGGSFTPLNDSYVTSRFSAQNHSSLSPLTQMSLQQPRNSQFINSHWNGWSDMRAGGNIGITEMLRNERFGLGNFYSSNDENNFHISSSNDLYNRAFGM